MSAVRERRAGRGAWLALVLLVVPVAAAVALWLWQADRADAADEARAADRAALDAATRETLTWATVDHRDIDTFVTEVKAGATGEFLEQFEQSEQALRTLIAQNESVQVPSIPKGGAALMERSGGEARVLVVMDAEVTNKSTETPQPRQYRLLVTMAEVDGDWKISRLEFVDEQA